MSVSLFGDQPETVSLFEVLNQEEEAKCTQAFRELAQRMSDPNSEPEEEPDSGSVQSIFKLILDRVAFFPAKPSLLQQELSRLGVRNSLSESLSQVWAENAKKIVAEKKKVSSDLKRIDYEVVKEVVSQDETVNLYLHDQLDRLTLLTFTPQQLFSFYHELENIQTSIDSICK